MDYPPRQQTKVDPLHNPFTPSILSATQKDCPPVNYSTRAIIHKKNTFFRGNKIEISLFPTNIHRIGFLDPKSQFFRNIFIGPESLSEIRPTWQKIVKSVPQKVSGKCSHIFSRFFAPEMPLFPRQFCSSNCSSNFHLISAKWWDQMFSTTEKDLRPRRAIFWE